jgi:hypothetical protein
LRNDVEGRQGAGARFSSTGADNFALQVTKRYLGAAPELLRDEAQQYQHQDW